jgi:hypothetical protein|tara:strand:- start:1642 stop:1983 length:342 start_codon:yes stop_codon:yes gene_type:complete
MKNYLLEFKKIKKRNPTELEVGLMMKAVAMKEPHRKKSDAYLKRFENAKDTGALGGRTKIPIRLNTNATRVNDLLTVGICERKISNMLDLDISSVRSLRSKYKLPRAKEYIIK